jgi:peptidyl-dipeptidase Dcp
LYRERDTLGLAQDEMRLLEQRHRDYLRSGVALKDADGARLVAIKERLAELDVVFQRNLMSATDAFELTLTEESQLSGLPDFVRATARREPANGQPVHYVFTLKYASVTTFLTYSAQRGLREILWRAWTRRAGEGAFDNRQIASEMVMLRQELARLLGYRNYAEFVLEDRMAGTPGRVLSLLNTVWEPAKALCRSELEDLRSLAAELGEPTDIEPWDWRYLADKLRNRRFKLDMPAISQHLELESVIDAAFGSAARLFGLSFHERHDVPLHHPDARLWEVRRHGRTSGYFVGDYFARERKQSGAWESEFRLQSRDDAPTLPIVINSTSFLRDTSGRTLLDIDQTTTVFHEFGHALHSLLSDVRFNRQSGTRVARDFVEVPSHLFENWVWQPEVLSRHAKHVETGAPLPLETIGQIKASRTFNEGFELVRYLAPALMDIALHSLESPEPIDIDAFEATQLADLDAIPEADVNMHLPNFRHIFSEDGYAVGYYGYLWAQVLEADIFAAFEEAGDPFAEQVAQRLHDSLLSRGGAVDPSAAFHEFRSREPDIAALARKRGFARWLSAG